MTADRATKRNHILMVVNPTAGAARSARLRSVVDRLKDFGCLIRVQETRSAGDVCDLLADPSSADLDVIVAAGGDGTINGVLNALPKKAPPLAILPLGTVNVLAREIALPRSIEEIAETIAFGPSRAISIGEVNGRRFAVMASVGLDAEVVEHVSPSLKRYVGKWAYLLESLKQSALKPRPTYRLRMGGVERHAHGVIVANGRHYAGPYVTAPAAHLEKPVLDICRLTRPGRLAAPCYLTSLALGRFAKRADVMIDEATELEILEPEGAPVQGDGDLLGRLPARIRIRPGSVDLIFPRAMPAHDGFS